MSLNEAITRAKLIDPALKEAGWDVNDSNRVGIEIPVDGFDPAAWAGLEGRIQQLRERELTLTTELPSGISDYVLKRENGEIVAVVEAKRMSVDVRLAVAQTEFYVTELEKRQSFRPFGFMSNGREIYFWDVGRANNRLVQGFFSPEDLENLLHLRENEKPLAETPINTSISDRSYQIEAIRRVCEAFEQGKRRALLVMATGTGKTRVAMSLVDVFLRSDQARRILFVADRDALVTQALKEGFEEHIPDEPCTRIYTHSIDKTKRLYAATLQTLSNCFRKFTPAFFDLIIFDEVHRSIFNKWNEVLQYFDGRMVGLTATPAGFIDRNTFLEFECFDEKPTFLYTYEEAIPDYLVDYALYAAQTGFQRSGIRGVNLSEENRNLLIEQGLDPDEIDFSGTDLEKEVTNRDTLRQQWQEIMDVCYRDESGQLPGKTIVFAMTQDHALRLEQAFNETHPQFPGLAQVITYKSNWKGTLIEGFKKNDFPRIAISVDMLETGVNVPECVNLVFMRPVHSRIKLEQMIGRGTRSHETCTYPQWLPNGHKDGFQIIDFWENDFRKQPQEEVVQSLPVLVSLFNTRIKLLALGLSKGWSQETQHTIADLRAMIARIPSDSYAVKRVWPEIEEVWGDAFWQYITGADIDLLRLKVGPLLRYAPGVDVQAETFTHKVERLKMQQLTDRDASATLNAIREDVARLTDFVREDESHAALIDFCLSPDLDAASPAQLDQVIEGLSGQMRYRRRQDTGPLELDLRDFIAERGYILLFGGAQEVYVETYRQQVEERILELAVNHPTVAAMERGEPVSDDQLLELERTLRRELGGSAVELSEDNIRKAFGLRVGSLMEFMRELLELQGIPDYKEIVGRAFDGFVAEHQLNADQTRFLRVVQTVFLQKRHLELPDLYDPPLTRFGDDAADRLFSTEELSELLALTAHLSIPTGHSP
ncbi:MAG: DEAD/DEAH box helicase family protein [Chloroflexi bacterium]|nr:DEAD/DEAH box helicase family protein [Chloroflexota bacterium]